ncbi:MAG: DNA polymerase III subunit gamma/tau [Chloroflexi bacterium]|nr:DNA polymerase III subunit gamma/tau [Chloroflexota bacterium]
MAEQVLYRKWRPQGLADVAGQDHIVQTLRNALSTGRIAHAYLFCGPRGTGKTSTGRILAKAVNCLTTGGRGDPCNHCAMCQSITDGRAMDLIEIDAASNRGIDEIRDLREKVRFAPVEGRYKVYIIDEVHMLTDYAFNALLKTLEEPPPQTLFVLATTEAHKLPATVISRCQRFDFRRLSPAAVAGRLDQICKGEGIEGDPAVLRSIAQAAGGSLRDAINLLEQLTTAFGPQLQLGPVQSTLGLASDTRAKELAACILKGDVAGGLKVVNQASQDGADLKQMQRSLVEFLRGVLLVKSGAADALDAPEDAIADMKALAATPVERILKAVRLLGQTEFHLEGHPTLPLELAMVECSLTTEAPPAGARPPAARRDPASPPRSQPPPAQPRPRERMEEPPPVRSPLPANGPTPQSVEDSRPIPTTIEPVAEDAIAQVIEQLRGGWKDVIQACRGKGQGVKFDALLRSAQPLTIEGDTLVIGFGFTFHRDKASQELENPVSRKAVEDAVARVAGHRLRLRCTLAERPKPVQPSGHLVRDALQMGARVADDSEPS